MEIFSEQMSLIESITKFLESDPNNAKFIHWYEVSKLNLSSEFIRKYKNNVHWPTLCMYQNLDLSIINEFSDKIDYLLLSKNNELSEDTLTKIIDRLDWEKVQKYRKLSINFISDNSINLDPVLMLKHQKLSNDIIEGILESSGKHFDEFIVLAIEHQTLTTAFIDKYAGKFNLCLFINKQKISSEWIFNNFELLNQKEQEEMFVCQTAPVELLEDPNIVVKFIEPILIKQKLLESIINNEFIILCEKLHQTSNLVEHQLLNEDQYTTIALTANDEILTKIFLKTLKNPEFDKLSDNLAAKLNWLTVANHEIDEDLFIILRKRYENVVPSYLILKNNKYTENTLSQNGIIEWCAVIFSDKYPEEFTKQYEKHLKWWKSLTLVQMNQFIEKLLMVSEYDISKISKIQTQDEMVAYCLKSFLLDYIKQANWKNLLHEEKLPEPIITLFSKYSNLIKDFWWKVIRFQTLSENFIRKNLEHMNMTQVKRYQTGLTPEFLLEFTEFFEDE